VTMVSASPSENQPFLLGTVAVVLLCCAPALVVILPTHPPLTDYPQHAAVASILDHLHDPNFGFDRYYSLDIGRTLYWLPYALAWLLGKVFGVELGLRVVIGLSTIAVPLGVLAVVRATGRPASVALLAVPLTFNQGLFFGFHHFLLAVGLAFMTYALLIAKSWSVGRGVLSTLALVASVLTHVYGLALVLGMTALHSIFGDRSRLRRRVIVLAPAVIGAAVWIWLGSRPPGYGQPQSPALAARVLALPVAILGGYRDGTETILLLLVLGATVTGTLPCLRRWREIPAWRRAVLTGLCGNLLLYFVLPQHTATAKFIHFRHAVLAALFLPLAASVEGLRRMRALAWLLTTGTAAFALVNAGVHAFAFEREASEFDMVVEAIPMRSRVLGVVADPRSDGFATTPYVHFPAYVQARRGGILAVTFPHLFWNMPVAMRADAGVPPTPVDFEWRPGVYNEHQFGWFYDWAIVRLPTDGMLAQSPEFPFDLVLTQGRWQLYRRVGPK
jgi:hypothetical protein